jgi:hypothetical protein
MPRVYPRVEHLQGASLRLALALPAIIRLGRKGLPGKNTLAYYENLKITDRKSFIIFGPGINSGRKSFMEMLSNWGYSKPVSLLRPRIEQHVLDTNAGKQLS